MNTRIIYNTNIKVSLPGSSGVGFIESVKLDEEGYKLLLEQIETKKFITVINTKQNPVTIKTEYIYKIDTKIELESDMKITEEE